MPRRVTPSPAAILGAGVSLSHLSSFRGPAHGPVCARMREVSKMSFSGEERRLGWLSELLERASEEVRRTGHLEYERF